MFLNQSDQFDPFNYFGLSGFCLINPKLNFLPLISVSGFKNNQNE